MVAAAQFSVLMETCVVDMESGTRQHCFVNVIMDMLVMTVNLFVIVVLRVEATVCAMTRDSASVQVDLLEQIVTMNVTETVTVMEMVIALCVDIVYVILASPDQTAQ